MKAMNILVISVVMAVGSLFLFNEKAAATSGDVERDFQLHSVMSGKSVPSFVEVGKAYHFHSGEQLVHCGRVVEIYGKGWIQLERISLPNGAKIYRDPIIWINTNNTFMIAPPDKRVPKRLR